MHKLAIKGMENTRTKATTLCLCALLLSQFMPFTLQSISEYYCLRLSHCRPLIHSEYLMNRKQAPKVNN